MAIEPISHELCTGCGVCIDTCPMDVIWMDEKHGKAVVRYEEDCMLCYACELDCSENAIYVSPRKDALFTLAWG